MSMNAQIGMVSALRAKKNFLTIGRRHLENGVEMGMIQQRNAVVEKNAVQTFVHVQMEPRSAQTTTNLCLNRERKIRMLKVVVLPDVLMRFMEHVQQG